MVDKQIPIDLDEATFLNLGNKILKYIYENRPQFGDKFPVNAELPSLSENPLIKSMPEEGMSPYTIFNEVLKEVMPQNLPTHHPAFLAFIPSPGSLISALGNLIADGHNVFAGHWLAGKGAAQIETIVLQWLTNIFGFPEQTSGGIFTSGGSMANLTALFAARVHKLGEDWEKGVFYYSEQTHSSWAKAAKILGFKTHQHRAIPVNAEMQLDTDYLLDQIEEDLHNGFKPFCITANAGTTNTGTIDDLEQIAAITQKYQLWFHIDGAYGAAAMLCDKGKKQLKGIELADSLTLDPHKWWFQVYELGCLIVKNKATLRNAFQVGASYLDETKNGQEEHINYYEYGPQLTRSFKVLKFFITLKTIGLHQMGEMIGKGIANAEWIEQQLRLKSHWEITSKAQLGILTFRYKPVDFKGDLDELNKRISHKLIKEGKIFLLTTTIKNQVVLRMCPIHPDLTKANLLEIMDDLESV